MSLGIMRAPEFWARDGGIPALLSPLSALTAMASRRRIQGGTPWRAPVPVICVGNLVAGGSGKTPVAMALAEQLLAQGRAPHFLTRGYRGRAAGPLRVDPARHDAREVGDEALLLAALAPTWVARDRRCGAEAAVAAGADVIVMDDGFQNPSLAKDLSLLVVDGGYGFGNGRVLPAGPLREPVPCGLARAHAVVLVGEDRAGVKARVGDRPPVIEVRLVPLPGSERLGGRAVVAFAGIGRPEKFFATLEAIGCRLAARHAFADHHVYRESELLNLADEADRLGALLVTTAKDIVRVPEAFRPQIEVLEVRLGWQHPTEIEALLKGLFTHG